MHSNLVLVGIAGLLGACAISPVPEANGYNVELYFAGAPLGDTTQVGDPALVTVKRIEQRTDRCVAGSASCDPTTETPITLVSASCDDVCTVTAIPGEDGVVSLQAMGARAGSTTLRVHVRSQIDGAEWDDGYPLSFRDGTSSRAIAPSARVIDKSSHEK